MLRSLSYAANRPAQANAVYVNGGESGGILARVVREGTAGDLLLPVASHVCITSVDAARILGTRLLAAQQRQPKVVAITLPLGQDIPLSAVGDMLALQIDDGSEIRGVVNSVQISATWGGTVVQTVRIGEQTDNRWAAWRNLLPQSPLLWATVIAVHADGTYTVEYPGGGLQRVAGEATVGSNVWVRGRRIEDEAPALPGYEITV